MTNKEKTLFQQLKEIDVSKHVEKKNKFSYLSWAWALDIMYQFDENAQYEYPEREVFGDGTVMIYCDVTIKGNKKRGFLPVMDFKNNAVQNPDARKISDSMQRCLVKTIALHGLGLSLYAGEDLPEESVKPPKEAPKVAPKKSWEQIRANEIAMAIKAHVKPEALEKMWEANTNDLDKINKVSEKAYGALQDAYQLKLTELDYSVAVSQSPFTSEQQVYKFMHKDLRGGEDE